MINKKKYKLFFTQVKAQIKTCQAKAAISVNSSLIQLYWQLGHLIVEKQKENAWGNSVIEQLAKDLKKELPALSGFSRANLFFIRKFYQFYSSEKVLQPVRLLKKLPAKNKKVLQAVRQLPGKFDAEKSLSLVRQLVTGIPWGHHITILTKVKDPKAALFYIQQTIEYNWSRNMLSFHIEQNLFKRQGKAVTNFSSTLPKKQAILAQQILKDPYNFNFLTLESKVQELDLEKQLTDHITKFLLELGKGFAFIGRQYPITVGKTDFFIDLLFYHIRLRCFVVIDLKTTPFIAEYAGKMNFYLSAVDNLLKTNEDQPSMGILLCKNKESIEVEYALTGINRPIGVSDFTFTEGLPDELKSSIPTVEEFENEINRVSELNS